MLRDAHRISWGLFPARADWLIACGSRIEGTTMSLRRRLFVGIVVALGLFVPVAGQQSKAQAPTTKDPLRFRAVLQTQGQDAGAQGVVQIVIERWSTTAERESLVALVSQSTDKRGGQDKLLKALGKITPRVGFIRTPNSLGWDLRYAYDFMQPDGTRKIVIATDKPVSFGAAVAGAESLDYPFTLIEMRMGANSKGEGRMLARSAISTKDGKIELENYGNEPIKMSEITEEAKNK